MNIFRPLDFSIDTHRLIFVPFMTLLAVLRTDARPRLLSHLRAPTQLHIPRRTAAHSTTTHHSGGRAAAHRHRCRPRGSGRRCGLLLLELLDVSLVRRPMVVVVDPPAAPSAPVGAPGVRGGLLSVQEEARRKED